MDVAPHQTSELERRLQRLEDQRAILELLYQYGHCLDYGLEDEFEDLWTFDATLDYHGRPPYVGRSEIRGTCERHTRAPAALHKHLVLAPLIRIDGDAATAVSYFIRLDGHADGPMVRSFGRYHDELARCDDGRWRFRLRRHEPEARTPAAWAEAARKADDERNRRTLSGH